MSDLVGNPDDMFSRVASHFISHFHITETSPTSRMIVLVLLSMVSLVRADYECLCNYNVETPVLEKVGSFPHWRRVMSLNKTHEPVRKKTQQFGFRPSPTQTGLYSHRRWIEAGNFGFRK